MTENIMTSDPGARYRRRTAISRHNLQKGIDFVNTGHDSEYKNIYLYFIPSQYDGKKAVPDLKKDNLAILDHDRAGSVSRVDIKDIKQGKWEFDIDSFIDTCIYFDGGSSISCKNEADIKGKSFTVEFWAKRDLSVKKNSGFQTIVGRGPLSAHHCLNIGFDSLGNFCFKFYRDDLHTKNPVSDESWHHFACVCDEPAGRQIIYIDGNLEVSRKMSSAYKGDGDIVIGDSSLNSFHFGKRKGDGDFVYNLSRTAAIGDAWQNSYRFIGHIAELRIWNKALSKEKIAKKMYNRLLGDEKNLIGYWLFGKDSETIEQHDGIRITAGEPVIVKGDIPVPKGYIIDKEGEPVLEEKQVIETCFYLDGNTFARCEKNVDLANKSFTVEFWARPDFLDDELNTKTEFKTIIGQGPLYKNRCLNIGFDEQNRFCFGFYKDDLKMDSPEKESGWHHFACIYDAKAGKQTIYKDGVKAAERVASDCFYGTGELIIGKGPLSSYMFGKRLSGISEDCNVWNKVINASANPAAAKENFFKGYIAELRVWLGVRSYEELNAEMFTRIKEDAPCLALYQPFSDRVDYTKSSSGLIIDGSIKIREKKVSLPANFELTKEIDRKIERLRLYKDSDCVTVTLDRKAEEPDSSRYTLNLSNVAGIDRFFETALFSFNKDCIFDPAPAAAQEAGLETVTEIDYLSKDYKSFRNLMLDRMSVLCPDWAPQVPADQGMAVVEAIAYSADYLSYYQDAVAAEAYLNTARHRVSIGRHARLLDYFMHQGASARVFVHIKVKNDAFLEKGTRLLTKTDGQAAVIKQDVFEKEIMGSGAAVFETMHDTRLFPSHNIMHFYTWNGNAAFLPKDSTKAFLKGKFKNLKIGDVLIFEQIKGALTGLEADADPNMRHIVRLTNVEYISDPLYAEDLTVIKWDQDEALPFDMEIASQNTSKICSAIGNIVLADHGMTVQKETLETVPSNSRYTPALSRTNISYSEPYEHEKAVLKPSIDSLVQDVRAAIACVTLTETKHKEKWRPVRDFLDTDRFTPAFAVEIENDGRAYLRFGDNAFGKKPEPGTIFTAQYRIGGSVAGNIGRDIIEHIVTDSDDIISVRNPTSSRGGTLPEDMEKVRLHAPYSLQSQKRCVTIDDYIEKIEAHPEVQRAAASLKWTGSRQTVFIAIDRLGDTLADQDFCDKLERYMEEFRLAGKSIKIQAPEFAALEIALTVSTETGYFKSTVEQYLLETFSNIELLGKTKGFFHPDNFTFGQNVYLSKIIAAAKKTAGVKEVEITMFKRWGRDAAGELEDGKIKIWPLEIARLDNDPEAPENGTITFTVT